MPHWHRSVSDFGSGLGNQVVSKGRMPAHLGVDGCLVVQRLAGVEPVEGNRGEQLAENEPTLRGWRAVVSNRREYQSRPRGLAGWAATHKV